MKRDCGIEQMEGISGGSRKTRIETIQFSRPDLSG